MTMFMRKETKDDATERGYGIGGETVVHCSQHHLFTTIWTPSASLKALHLGPTRLQRSPRAPAVS
jgi:hypothetical protein